MTHVLPPATAGYINPERQRRIEKMNYIYILIGTLFTVALVAQMVAYAASTKKSKVKVGKSHINQA